ncbi:MAG TPA: hypothetical protein VFA46_21850 [Actinomycetes bacterium]|jgi:hypothetical protein|nr:hypothetical protein [Actinomycetes bacterium]
MPGGLIEQPRAHRDPAVRRALDQLDGIPAPGMSQQRADRHRQHPLVRLGGDRHLHWRLIQVGRRPRVGQPDVTGTVACAAPLPLPPWPSWPVPVPARTATRPTVATLPRMRLPSGSVTSTRPPRRTSCSTAGSNATVTSGRVEVAVRIAVPAPSGAPPSR